MWGFSFAFCSAFRIMTDGMNCRKTVIAAKADKQEVSREPRYGACVVPCSTRVKALMPMARAGSSERTFTKVPTGWMKDHGARPIGDGRLSSTTGVGNCQQSGEQRDHLGYLRSPLEDAPVATMGSCQSALGLHSRALKRSSMLLLTRSAA